MLFESLMNTDLLVKVLGLAFVTIMIAGSVEFSYRTEEIGDEE